MTIAQHALGITYDSLIVETAKVFGISYSDKEEAREVFSEVLKRLVRERKLCCKEDGVVTVA
jgi:histone H3/H4